MKRIIALVAGLVVLVAGLSTGAGARSSLVRRAPGAIRAMVALGCGVGVVPELVRKDSPLRGRIEQVAVRRGPRLTG